MTIENQDFDKKLVELNAQLKALQTKIVETEQARNEYIINGLENKRRKQFLLENSLPLKEVKLEKIDGIYFIIAADNTFEYVVRLTKNQAETLADDLDDELNKDLQDQVLKDEKIERNDVQFIHDMFAPLFQNIKK